jgi:hypothetical protein
MSTTIFTNECRDAVTKARFSAGLIANANVRHFRSDGSVVSVTDPIEKPMDALKEEVDARFGKSNTVIAHSQADIDSYFRLANKLSFASDEAKQIGFVSLIAPTILVLAADYNSASAFISANDLDGKLQFAVEGEANTQLGVIIVKNNSANNIEVGFDCTPKSGDATASIPTITGLETIGDTGSVLLTDGQAVQFNSVVMTASGTEGGVTATAVSGQSDINS